MKTEIEKRASKFIDETDMMQFSTMEIMVMFAEKELEAINYTHCCTELPTSTQLLSDCKKRFKELEGKGNLDFRSYKNGYLDSFSKNVISKIK